MLIRTERHTAQDLQLWEELHQADMLWYYRHGLRQKVAESLNAILDFSAKGDFYFGTSWGKDSVVALHLVLSVRPQTVVMHLRPSNHNPDCDLVRDRYLEEFEVQYYDEITVDYSGIDRLALPHQELDRLTDLRWYAAIHDYERKVSKRHMLGIRADESGGRRIRTLRWGLNSPNGSAPIAKWNTQDVFAYLAGNRLPIHPAYAMLGGGRWPRERLRVAEIGDSHGTGGGRREWELEYYGDVLRRIEAGKYSAEPTVGRHLS
jgi:phosphoadenosine phosphosulfate reductase